MQLDPSSISFFLLPKTLSTLQLDQSQIFQSSLQTGHLAIHRHEDRHICLSHFGLPQLLTPHKGFKGLGLHRLSKSQYLHILDPDDFIICCLLLHEFALCMYLKTPTALQT